MDAIDFALRGEYITLDALLKEIGRASCRERVLASV